MFFIVSVRFTRPAPFSSSSCGNLFDGSTVMGEATGATGMGILGILSSNLMWLLCSPSFTKFTLHLGIARTAEANGCGAPSDGCDGDLLGEDVDSSVGGDVRRP